MVPSHYFLRPGHLHDDVFSVSLGWYHKVHNIMYFWHFLSALLVELQWNVAWMMNTKTGCSYPWKIDSYGQSKVRATTFDISDTSLLLPVGAVEGGYILFVALFFQKTTSVKAWHNLGSKNTVIQNTDRILVFVKSTRMQLHVIHN